MSRGSHRLNRSRQPEFGRMRRRSPRCVRVVLSHMFDLSHGQLAKNLKFRPTQSRLFISYKAVGDAAVIALAREVCLG